MQDIEQREEKDNIPKYSGESVWTISSKLIWWSTDDSNIYDSDSPALVFYNGNRKMKLFKEKMK